MFLHLAKSAFQPEEVAELRAVFDEITRQPWFRKDAKEEFARYLFKTLPANIQDSRAFRASMETTARHHFSYDGLSGLKQSEDSVQSHGR